MRVVRPLARKWASVALIMGLTASGITLFDLGPTPSARGAPYAKLIILWCRAFEPVGLVSDNGLTCELLSTGEIRLFQPGESLRIDVAVFQPSTGALGFGHVQAPLGTPDDPPQAKLVRVHAFPGGPRFEAGPATATASAVRRFRGVPTNEWTWTSEVELIVEP